MVRSNPQVRKLAKLGARKLTRAHLALAQRPALGEAMAQAAGAVAARLSERLGAPVEIAVKLLDAAVRGPDSLAFPAAFALIALDETGGFAVLELPCQLCSTLVDRLAGGPGEPAAAMPLSEAEEAGTSLLLLEALAALRSGAAEKMLAPRLVGIFHSAAELSAVAPLRERHLALRLRVICEKLCVDARLLVPAVALRSGLEAIPPTPPTLDSAIAAISLPFSLRGGKTALAVEDLVALVEGDVVLLEGLQSGSDAVLGGARLIGTGFAMTGHIGPDGFAVENLSLNKELAMNEKTQVTRAADLPVEVEVELCRVKLTVAELGAIQPGGMVPLRIGTGEPVQLKVGEQVVAVAELVDIEGEIGARILRLCK